MAMEVVQEDMGEDSMYCSQHPYKTSTAGGICAFCLQEKLGNLVSSSFPIAIFPSTSSSQSQSFRSDFTTTTTTTATTTTTTTTSAALALQHPIVPTKNINSRSSKSPFSSTQKRNNKKDGMMGFQRSKSTTTPRNHMHFGDVQEKDNQNKKGFWSFLYPSSSKHSKKNDVTYKDSTFEKQKQIEEFIVLEEDDLGSLERKVSRSRSVGCGSRSFSGDIFDRISTGFGDCTLRRVESQREGNHKNGKDSIMKERVRCGGIFGGFMMISSSSSSSSSSSYWVSSSSAEDQNMNGKTPASVGNHKSWGWALASPMRSFSNKQSSKVKSTAQNDTPNLAAIPTLLGART